MTEQILAILKAHASRPQAATEGVLQIMDPHLARSARSRARVMEETRQAQIFVTGFIIPGSSVKNGDDRLVVLNRVALSVIEGRRGIDPPYVFTYKGRPISRMLTYS
jgi:hypothetical protein